MWGVKELLLHCWAVPSEQLSSLLTLSLSALPWTYLLYSLILSAQLRSGCLTVFFSRLLALANQLETWKKERKRQKLMGTLQINTYVIVLIPNTSTVIAKQRLSFMKMSALCLPSVSFTKTKRDQGKRQKQSQVAEQLSETELWETSQMLQRDTPACIFSISTPCRNI